MRNLSALMMIACAILATAETALAQPPTPQQASEALHKVVSFYRTQVGYRGAYLWRYSSDLQRQEGEETASRTSGWTQPPGAPFVGEAYLKAWRLSGDDVCLQAAVEVADALVQSQLKSGGWSSHFELGENGRRRYAYRVDGDKAGKNDYTTFDDNKSQSALMLLMHVDEATQFQHAATHEAVEYALTHMLAAQYPNGAWPQQYTAPPNAADFPVLKASYPPSWSRVFPKNKYVSYYTLNDGNMSHIVDMLFEADRIYKRDDCYHAAEKTGDFFLMAQMPEPQPGWAQQYNAAMHPAWARKFEPPAVTGGESQDVMKTLLTLYRFTGNKKYVATIPRALEYYRSSLLPGRQLARFYELQTNRPLYFTKDYQLTYRDDDLPTHYGFKVGSGGLDFIQRELASMAQSPPDDLKPQHEILAPVKLSKRVTERAATVMKLLDNRGAWTGQGRMQHHDEALEVIDMKTFAKNLEPLAACAGATSGQ